MFLSALCGWSHGGGLFDYSGIIFWLQFNMTLLREQKPLEFTFLPLLCERQRTDYMRTSRHLLPVIPESQKRISFWNWWVYKFWFHISRGYTVCPNRLYFIRFFTYLRLRIEIGKYICVCVLGKIICSFGLTCASEKSLNIQRKRDLQKKHDTEVWKWIHGIPRHTPAF